MDDFIRAGGQPEWLPHIECVAICSGMYFHKRDLRCVDIGITWYQRFYHLDIDETIRAALSGRKHHKLKWYSASDY